MKTGLICKTGLMILFLPRYGYVAGCIIVVASECLLLGGYALFGWKWFGNYFPWSGLVRILLAAGFMGTVLYVTGDMLSFWVRIPFGVVLYGALALLLRIVPLS